MASSVASNGSPTLRRTMDRSSLENPGLNDDAIDKMTTRMVSLSPLELQPLFCYFTVIFVPFKPTSSHTAISSFMSTLAELSQLVCQPNIIYAISFSNILHILLTNIDPGHC